VLFADAVLANENAIAAATKPQLRKLLPVLKQAEREMTVELGKWLHKQSPDDRYDKHRHRALLAQLKGSIATIEKKIAPAWYSDMDVEGEHVRTIAMNRLGAMVDAGAREFEGAIRPLRIDVASVMSSERQTMLAQMRRKGSAYSKDMVSDLNGRLSLGVIRGETIDQLTSRLLQSTGLIRAFKARGDNAVAEGASAKLFGKYRWWAESIARTELVNAYSVVQARSIREADKDDPGWLKKWDAAADRRVCRWCRLLDNETVSSDQSFRVVGRFGARPHPPLHTCCRCALVPWRAEWSAETSQRGRQTEYEAA
jgi:hypothetical protein